MKKCMIFILGIFPLLVEAQRVVLLPVDQPAALGFEALSRDLTITKGDSVILGNDLKVNGGTGVYSFKWSPGITLKDSTVMKPVARPVKNTTYFLTVTDKNGCSFSIDYKVTVKWATPASLIPSASEELNAWLYPNPNDGTFKIHLSGKPAPKVDIVFIDNLGRVVLNRPVYDFEGDQTETMQLNLTPGTYSLLIKKEKITLFRQFIIW